MTAIETTVKERPVLFKGEMVRAILEGRKTQTRRVMKPQPPVGWEPSDYAVLHKMIDGEFPMQNGLPINIGWGVVNEDGDKGFVCPYGKPGERLWVRETWASQIDPPDYEEHLDELDDCLERTEITYRATPRIGIRVPGYIQPIDRMRYLDESTALEHHCFGWPIKWKPSIFMPRWASRITLEVTNVRVERLQNITEKDVVAEGIEDIGAGDLRGMFQVLWQSINEAKHPWSSNPFVWCISFRRIDNAR